MLYKLLPYLKDPFRIGYGLIRRVAPLIKNDETYLKILYFLKRHRRLNLNNPKTFSEKIQWLKLYDRKREYTMMVDKYAVKEYVAGIIGHEYIIPTIGVWDRPEDIEWDKLPDKFVLKTTHGGGSVGVVICRDKKDFDKKRALNKLRKSLKQDIYMQLREWPYKDVKKRIIAEPLLENSIVSDLDLTDYKFYCFNGNPMYCQVIRDRHKKETIDFFDMDWNHQHFIGLNPLAVHSDGILSIPKGFVDMKRIAQQLSSGNTFSRIDLYEVNGRIYFGEITLYPASGLGKFTPDCYNRKLGEMINLSK